MQEMLNNMVYIEKELIEKRRIIISSSIDAKVADRIMKQLLIMDDNNNEKNITVYINSPGGDVFSGFAIYDMMQFIESPVITLVTGFAASMGSIIMLAAEKGNRFALPNSKVLIHQPLIPGVFQGRATEIEIQAKEIDQTKQRIIDLYAKETGKNKDQIAKDIDNDYWLTAEEACEYGLIDKIIKNVKDI